MGQEKRDELADTVTRAALSQSSLTDAWEAHPGNYSRRELARTLAQVDLEVLAAEANQSLWRAIKAQLPRRFMVSIDLTDIPYHGEDARTTPHTIQGQAKDGTTWKHRYATAYVTHDNHRYTLTALLVQNKEKPHQALRHVLERLANLGLLPRIEKVLADKGFYSVDAIRCLKEHNLAFIIPMQNRARQIKTWCSHKQNGWRNFTVGAIYGKHERVRVALVHVANRGKKPPETFAYATHNITGSTATVHQHYLKRNGIETGYRLNNTTRARTSSRRIETRVLYFTLSMLLQNAWIRTQHHHPPPTRLRYRAFLRLLHTLINNQTANPPQPGAT